MIEELKVYNFRCIKYMHLKFSKGINLIYGKNAQGKTTIIEAVYFLATGKSFRTKKNKELISYSVDNSVIFAKDGENKYSVDIREENKQFYLNGDKNKYVDHIGNIFAISLIPEDTKLITGSPNDRRNFFNYEISQQNKQYLTNLLSYQKILKIRNNYLKKGLNDKKLRDIYETRYANLNYQIMKDRSEYINDLNKVVNILYKNLFNKNDELEIKYKPNLDINMSPEKIKSYLLSKKDSEEFQKYSVYGCHKDEYEIYLNQKLAKSYSSQGEKKSIVFAIKVAEIKMLKKENAIFLMDDINSFFDEYRQEKIVEYFKKNNIQTFITATIDQKIEGKIFNINGGEIIE